MKRRSFLGALLAAPVATLISPLPKERINIANVSPELAPDIRAALDEAYASYPTEKEYQSITLTFRDALRSVIERDLKTGNITVTLVD